MYFSSYTIYYLYYCNNIDIIYYCNNSITSPSRYITSLVLSTESTLLQDINKFTIPDLSGNKQADIGLMNVHYTVQ